MKKKWTIFIVIVLILGIMAAIYLIKQQAIKAEQKRINDEYLTSLKNTAGEIYFLSNVNNAICGKISEVWQEIGPKFIYNLPYALEIELKKIAGYEEIKKRKEGIAGKLEALTKAPEDLKKSFEVIFETYGNYVKLNNLAVRPSGSYLTFIKDYNDNYNEIQRGLSQLYLLNPGFKEHAELETKNSELVKKIEAIPAFVLCVWAMGKTIEDLEKK